MSSSFDLSLLRDVAIVFEGDYAKKPVPDYPRIPAPLLSLMKATFVDTLPWNLLCLPVAGVYVCGWLNANVRKKVDARPDCTTHSCRHL